MTLDAAYDGGGVGAGRTINADAGNVEIQGAGKLTVASNIGIGTTTPAEKLEIEFTGRGGILLDANDTQDALIQFENGGGSHYIFDDDDGGHALKLESATGSEIVFNTDGSNECVVIKSDGRLRVNNLAYPNFAVVLSSNTGVLGKVALTGNATDVLLGNGSFGPSSAFADDDWYTALSTIPPTSINDNIYTKGRVGIGNNNPATTLDVTGSAYVGSGESRFWNGTYTDPHSGTPY